MKIGKIVVFFLLAGAFPALNAQNMNHCMILHLEKSGRRLNLQFAANAENTGVRLVVPYITNDGNGGQIHWPDTVLMSDTVLPVGTSWVNYDFIPGDTVVMIFGDVSRFVCVRDDLTLVDVSQNPELVWLSCGMNGITTLDVSHNPKLERLECDETRLTTLDVGHNPELKELYCHHNSPLGPSDRGFTSLDVSRNPKLKRLACHNNKLTSLDVSGNPELEELDCHTNEIASLSVCNYGALKRLVCWENPLPTMAYDHIMCGLPERPVSDAAVFCPIYSAQDTNAPKFMASCSANAKAKGWLVKYEYNGTDIPATSGTYDCALDMEHYITLTIPKGGFLSVGLKPASAEKYKAVVVNGPDSLTLVLDYGHLTYYEGLAADTVVSIYGSFCEICAYSNNCMTSLDVSHCPDLVDLDCIRNKLTTLDVSHNPKLKRLKCTYNQLRSLHVGSNTGLVKLECYYNQLTSLDLGNAPELVELPCFYNRLTSLDVSHCPELASLKCDINRLTTLDVSQNPNLKVLACGNNNLASLDVSKNNVLTDLACSNNRLTTLDVGDCPALVYLDCYGNNFSTEAWDALMCSLPDRDVDTGVFHPLFTTENSEVFKAANADNARAKLWHVCYVDTVSWKSGEAIVTTGNFDCATVPVREAVAESALRVWPNPARTELHFSGVSGGNVIVHDLTGRVVWRSEAGRDEVVVNIADWARGMYFVRSGSHTLKFVKE